MLTTALVSSRQELEAILELNAQNIRGRVCAEDEMKDGFVTWLYTIELLERMQVLTPSVIVKDNDRVVAYALATPISSRDFHPDLEVLFKNLDRVKYKGRMLFSYKFYCMGQICVAQEYRGQGLVKMLYDKHKEVYGGTYDFVLTEISTSNPRSLKAHENIGFIPIHKYTDELDEWHVVIWDWMEELGKK